MAHPLDPVRLKIVRAYAQAEGLVEEIHAFYKAEPHGFAGEYEAETSEYVFRNRVWTDPPPQWGIVIGDFVHNLSSALDQLVWQVVILDGSTPIDGQTGFPVFEDCTKWNRERGGGAWMLTGMSTLHQAEIERLQPYHRDDAPSHPLAILRALWNLDKHRMIPTAVAQYASGGKIGFDIVRDVEAGQGEVAFPDARLIHGTEFARLKVRATGPNPKMSVKGELAVDIALGEPLPLLRLDTAMTQMHVTVRSIFQTFARDFPV